MTKNGTTRWRVSQLEKSVDKIAGKVDQILTNHLPHINEEIYKLREEIHNNKWKIGLIVGVASAIGGTALTFILQVLLI